MTLLATTREIGAGPSARAPIVLSVVIPTFNERANIEAMLEGLSACLGEVAWEVILVDDDSPDGTWSAARLLGMEDTRVRCLRRLRRRGLSGACIEGMLSSSANYVAVMDGDLQHDETILPTMLRACRSEGVDLVVGTRTADVADATAMSPARRRISALGRAMLRLSAGSEISDPMSGFFMVRRAVIDEIAPRLSTEGFKILADILLSTPRPLRVVEVSYGFRPRRNGTSKFNMLIASQYVGFLAHKLSRGLLPVRFVQFGIVGLCGVAVHLVVLRCALLWAKGLGFGPAQILATYVAMTGNFLLNNRFTFADRAYRGARAAAAFVAFGLVCSIGTIANANLASWIFANQATWWAAGFAGALVSSVWNYAASQTFVWPRRM